jgi:hypothetical protein
MRLSEWLEAQQLSYGKGAKALNLPNAATVLRYANGTHIPRPDVMRRIFERTAGAVTPADFYFDRLGQAERAPRKPAAGRRDNSRKPRRPDEAAP